MENDDSIDMDSWLPDKILSLAALNNVDIDDYITFLLEEEILKDITLSLVSDSSIY